MRMPWTVYRENRELRAQLSKVLTDHIRVRNGANRKVKQLIKENEKLHMDLNTSLATILEDCHDIIRLQEKLDRCKRMTEGNAPLVSYEEAH